MRRFRIFQFGLSSENAVNSSPSQWVLGKALLYIQRVNTLKAVTFFLLCLTLTQIDFNIVKFYWTGLEIMAVYGLMTK